MRASLSISQYPNQNKMPASPYRNRTQVSSQKNEEINALHGELDNLEHAKKDLHNRLKLVEELDGRYRSKL